MNLCTLLPDLPPADGAERVFFNSILRSDWCHDYDMDDHEESAIEYLEDHGIYFYSHSRQYLIGIYFYSHSRQYLIELAYRNGWRPAP
jgi:hypothetical protein